MTSKWKQIPLLNHSPEGEISTEAYKIATRKALRALCYNASVQAKIKEESSYGSPLEKAITGYREKMGMRLAYTAEDEKEHNTLLKRTQEKEKKVS
jgi:hypothetical protein